MSDAMTMSSGIALREDGEPANHEQRDVRKALLRMDPPEDAEERAVECRRVRDPRVAEQQREDGSERRPQDEGG